MDNEIFNIGLTLSIETRTKHHLQTPVLGWDTDAFILTKAIYVQGQPAKLQNNEACKIRFLKEGIAYGCETAVISIQFFPFPLMFLKYPARIECVKLRGAPRFKTDLPATLSDASGSFLANILMLDISAAGCCVSVPAQNGLKLSSEQGYFVAINLMGKEVCIGCAVKKLDRGADFTFLGMEFTAIPPQQQETLTMFLDFFKKHNAG